MNDQVEEADKALVVAKMNLARQVAKSIKFDNVEFIAYEIVGQSLDIALALKRELELWLSSEGVVDDN